MAEWRKTLLAITVPLCSHTNRCRNEKILFAWHDGTSTTQLDYLSWHKTYTLTLSSTAKPQPMWQRPSKKHRYFVKTPTFFGCPALFTFFLVHSHDSFICIRLIKRFCWLWWTFPCEISRNIHLPCTRKAVDLANTHNFCLFWRGISILAASLESMAISEKTIFIWCRERGV